jgi:hypothetical protein
MDKGLRVVFDNPRTADERLGRVATRRRTPGVLGIGALCLAVAGCATPRAIAPSERQAVIDRIVASTAKVMIEQGGRRLETGSGVVIASQDRGPGREAVSYVLTASHVLGGHDGADIIVRFTGSYAAQGRFVAALTCRGNPDTLDLALLKVPGIAVPPASFPESADQIRLGEEILLIGYPWGKRLGLFSGIVSQMPTDGREDATADEGTDPTIVVDAASSKGVSGGGVFREGTGTLIGVVEGYQTASIAVKDRSSAYSIKVPMSGETFVVPLTRIREFLRESGLDGVSGHE